MEFPLKETPPFIKGGFSMPKDKAEPKQTLSKFRELGGISNFLAKCSLALIPILGSAYVMHLPEYAGIIIYKEQYVSMFLTLLLTSTFLLTPVTKNAPRTKVPWYDVLFAILSLLSGGYAAIFYPTIVSELGFLVPSRILLGFILIVLVLEATRRLVGWPLVIIGAVSVLYAVFAFLLPGIFHSRMIPFGRIVTYLYLSSEGILGIALRVISTIVFSFIFFGQALFSVGAGQFISEFAMALMGKYRGGPAKVAIVASSLFGSISGSASANVAMTGVVTIPLMKRTGYKPHIAAAIEAVASTGGLILPPIMASTAFIIAEFLEIPYSKVAIAAFVPAILYYVAVFTQVHLEAVKEDLKGLPEEELPSLKKLIKKGWLYFIPPIVLIYFLFGLYMRASIAALYAVGASILISLLKKETREHIKKAPIDMLTNTGKGLLEVGIICAIAGIVIGSISLTGLGLSLADALVTISRGNVLILLSMAAIGAIILGMGMPVTPTYLMLVVLIAPALIKLGIEPLAAHLFIMYFGVMSFLTPPVAIAAYVAAGIAGSEPMRTGLAGLRLGIIAYVVPFVFALDPSLILIGSVTHILLTITSTLLGTVFLSVAFEGYMFESLNIIKRLFLASAAFLLFIPNLLTSLIGLALITFVVILEFIKKSRVIKLHN